MANIDITIPVLIDNAVAEYEATTRLLMDQTNTSIYLLECALERVLAGIRNDRIQLYGATIYGQKKELEEARSVTIEGTKAELEKMCINNGMDVSVSAKEADT